MHGQAPANLDAAIDARVRPSALELNHARLRVRARVPPAEAPCDNGWSHRIELQLSRSTIEHGGRPAIVAAVQVFGTFDRESRT